MESVTEWTPFLMLKAAIKHPRPQIFNSIRFNVKAVYSQVVLTAEMFNNSTAKGNHTIV